MSRERLPEIRASITRRFKVPFVDEHGKLQHFKFWATASVYDDNRIGELFLVGEKMGDLTHGALDALSTMISIALQHGVPLHELTTKLRHSQFGPSGRTGDKQFPSCTSMFDLVAQWLDFKFPDGKLSTSHYDHEVQG